MDNRNVAREFLMSRRAKATPEQADIATLGNYLAAAREED